MVETEYLWGNLLVNDYLEDREGSWKWMELSCPVVFFILTMLNLWVILLKTQL
jgi:hypothetical protein